MAISDETLIRQAVDLKDNEAFGQLVRRYQAKILLLQRRLTGEAALAQDLSQETFLRAWQKLDSFRGSGSFGGWLASLSYNVFLQHVRRHRRQRAESPLGEAELPAPERDDAALADLDRLLGVLEVEDQAIMVLSYAYGLSNSEVARVVGMPTGTVKARIHRAKAKIRERFDPQTRTGQPSVTRPVTGDDKAVATGSRSGASQKSTREGPSSHFHGQPIGAYRL
ncbi:MAG: RNA polymerase sigma factor [Pseudomonadales bacterium]